MAGDENRKTLLDLNVIDPLLNLIQHEDRIVRRNATMALGALASNGKLLSGPNCLGLCNLFIQILFTADVKRVLKKREETIQLMIHLLSPEGTSRHYFLINQSPL